MTRPDLDAVEARALAATPGPWRPHHDAAGNDAIEGPDGTPLCEAVQRPEAIDSRGNTIYGATVQWKRDADWLFAAAARSDIPALVARVRELERLLTVLVIREGGEIELDADDMARIPRAVLLIEAPHKFKAARILSVRVPEETP